MSTGNTPDEYLQAEPGSGPSRSRATRACDNCRSKRSKCLPVPDDPNQRACIQCTSAGLECTYTTPAKRRGPQPGFKRGTEATPPSPYSRESSSISARPPPQFTLRRQGNVSNERNERVTTRDRTLCGLPPDLVDELLAVYFTHVHNVWPIIYKPLFNPHTSSPSLLLSICAIASCVFPIPAETSHTPETLFRMAEDSIQHAESDTGYTIQLIQSFALLSLRQTGNGHKQSAFVYAGRACVGALSIGLNLKPSALIPAVEVEIRSRAYWNVFLLDKILAEETGRPVLLPYKRSSIPFPSINETDELESWPPLPMSSAQLPKSVRHIVPRRGHVMSCFVWGIRLAILYEEILGLEVHSSPMALTLEGSGGDGEGGVSWDREYDRWKKGDAVDIEGLVRQLEGWRKNFPAHLDVDRNPEVSPLPQSVILVAWYETARILLYSRLTPSRYPSVTPYSPLGALIENSQSICSTAAQDVIDLFALADRHRLLTSISADVIHILSLTTLFEAFDSTCPDDAVANRAKVNFAQCCIWLRDFSASWPTASAHKRFFEGLIQGGLRLTSWDDESHIDHNLDSGTPGVQGGLASFGRSLSTTQRKSRDRNTRRHEEMTDIFQLPQIYWNHLTNNDQIAGLSNTSGPLNLNMNMSMGVNDGSGVNQEGRAVSPAWTGAEGVLEESWWSNQHQQQQQQQTQQQQLGQSFIGSQQMEEQHGQQPSDGAAVEGQNGYITGQGSGNAGEQDQSAIYGALMTYLVQAARGHGVSG